MGLDYYLDIEGVQIRLSTYAFTGVGDGYTYVDAIEDISSVSYELDPIELTADVGVLEVSCIDKADATNTDGILSNLFGFRKPTEQRLYLDTTIQEADSMAGAGTIDVHANITNSTYPVNIYIERETFTATGDDGAKQFTGVTREAYDSLARQHIGYSAEDGYRPLVTLYPRYWTDRWCKLAVVEDLAIVGGDPVGDSVVWQGPISALTPAGLTGWRIRIGSVMKVINKAVVGGDRRPLAITSSIPAINEGVTVSDPVTGDPVAAPLGPLVDVSANSSIKTVRKALALTANGDTDTAWCTTLNEPNDTWNSQHALSWKSGDNYDADRVEYLATTFASLAGEFSAPGSYAERAAIVEDHNGATGEITIEDTSDDTDSGDTFDLIQWHTYPGLFFVDAWWAVLDAELVLMRGPIDLGEGFSMRTNGRWEILRFYAVNVTEGIYNGLEGGIVSSHAPGAKMKEVMSNYRYAAGSLSQYDNSSRELIVALTDKDLGLMTKNHPLHWFLELLHSTGQSWNGTYDVLTEQHGLGIPSSWVDDSGIFALSKEVGPTYRLGYTDPIKIKDMIAADIGAVLGLYPAVDENGKFTFKRIQFSNPAASVATITAADIASDTLPQVSTEIAGIVSKINIKFDRWPHTEKHHGTLETVWTDATRLYADSTTKTYETNVWLGQSSAAVNRDDHESFAKMIRGNALRVLQRSSQPQWLLTINVPLLKSLGTKKGYQLRPGDVCTVTLPTVPVPDGSRGLSAATMEVIGTRINPLEGTITLNLWHSLYDFNPGYWNWSAEVASWAAGTDTATIDTDLFKSGEDATDYIVAGEKLRIHYCATARAGGGVPYGTTEELTVDTVTASTIKFTASPAAALVPGDVIAVCDYDSASTAQKVYSFWSKENDANIIGDETIGAADNSPYVWV